VPLADSESVSPSPMARQNRAVSDSLMLPSR
jgi:hypothetical protein